MRKHPWAVVRCRPNFDCLEERALLSGGNPWAPGPGPMPAPPSTTPVHPEPPSFSPAAPGDGQGWPGRGDQAQVGSWGSQPNETPQSQPGGRNSSEPTVSPQQTIPDDDSPSEPVGTSSPPSIVGPSIPAGSFFQAKGDPAPSPAGPVASNAPAVEASIGAGKEPVEVIGAGNNSSIGSAASSPPAQLLAALDADGGVSTRLLAPADGFARENSLTGGASGPGSLAVSGLSGSAYNFGLGKMPTRDASTDRSVGRLQQLPGPKSADLITSVLPLDRGALDRAIDQFFQQFEEIDPDELVRPMSARIILYTLAVAGAYAGLDVVRRHWRQAKAGKYVRAPHALATAYPVGFPQLPGSWSSRLS
jgi:hypothetical protein